ncbi:FAD-dependent oxidoreductase [Streptomyces sp. NPDC002896]|uniref:FAD-dependent oxidoreductase n=1 Tax=Streptomyces sp. NPDC002896 TaxID=3154438 RepID=UPI00332820A5
MTSRTESATRPAWMPECWDMEADVVIAGYGGAGATCAAIATDAGQEVLLLEKGAVGGGNSACIAGSLLVASVDDDKSLEYLDWMCGGQTEKDVLLAYLDGLGRLAEFESRLGFPLKPDARPFRADGFFPEFPEAPGAEGFLGVSFIKAPGGAALFESIARLAESQGARVEYSTPVTALIQDPASGEILGVTASAPDGTRISVKARKAVVLATGGFEFNERMRQQYISHCPTLFSGSSNLTGEGIEMAQAAGAQLWHMNSVTGPLNWGVQVDPDTVYVTHEFMRMTGYGYNAGLFKDAGSVIWANKHGRRFYDETTEMAGLHHGYGNREPWFAMEVETAEFANVPAFQIFDQKAFDAGAAMTTKNSRLPAWSEDNRAELERGWIIKADTVEELARRCVFPTFPGASRGGHIDPGQLVDTVEEWNRMCAAGEDRHHGRAEFLTPLDTGPFYAVGPMLPTFINTHGGPKHDADQRVLDARDQPIPRLYAIGECGSMWGPYYNSMGDIAEFMISGRLAARHAAALTPWDETA